MATSIRTTCWRPIRKTWELCIVVLFYWSGNNTAYVSVTALCTRKQVTGCWWQSRPRSPLYDSVIRSYQLLLELPEFDVSISNELDRYRACAFSIVLRASNSQWNCVSYMTCTSFVSASQNWPRSGKLRTQKLKSHLVRTQSLNGLP